MIEYLYYILILILLLTIILKFRIFFLIRSNLQEIRNRRKGFMLFNKIRMLDFVFFKKAYTKYTFKISGITELELRDCDEIDEGFIQVMPLEVEFTKNFVKHLKNSHNLDKKWSQDSIRVFPKINKKKND